MLTLTTGITTVFADISIDRNSRGSHGVYVRGNYVEDGRGGQVHVDSASPLWWRIGQDDNNIMWRINNAGLQNSQDFIITNGASVGNGHTATIEQIVCLEGINTTNNDYANHVTCAPIDRNSRGNHSVYIRGKQFDPDHIIMDHNSQQWWKIAKDTDNPMGRITSIWHLGADALKTCTDFIISNGDQLPTGNASTIEQIVCLEGITATNDTSVNSITCVPIDRNSRGRRGVYIHGRKFDDNHILLDNNGPQWWKIGQDNDNPMQRILSVWHLGEEALKTCPGFIITNESHFSVGETPPLDQIVCYEGVETTHDPAVIEMSKNVKCVGIDNNSRGGHGTYIRGEKVNENHIKINPNSLLWWRIGQDDNNVMWRINNAGLQNSPNFIISNGAHFGNGASASMEQIVCFEGINTTNNDNANHFTCATIDRNSRGNHSVYIRGKQFDPDHIIMDHNSQQWWKIGKDNDNPMWRITNIWHLGPEALKTCTDFIISNGDYFSNGSAQPIDQIACAEGINSTNDPTAIEAGKNIKCVGIDWNARGSHGVYIRGSKPTNDHVRVDHNSTQWWRIGQDDNNVMWRINNAGLQNSQDFLISNGAYFGNGTAHTIDEINDREGMLLTYDPKATGMFQLPIVWGQYTKGTETLLNFLHQLRNYCGLLNGQNSTNLFDTIGALCKTGNFINCPFQPFDESVKQKITTALEDVQRTLDSKNYAKFTDKRLAMNLITIPSDVKFLEANGFSGICNFNFSLRNQCRACLQKITAIPQAADNDKPARLIDYAKCVGFNIDVATIDNLKIYGDYLRTNVSKDICS
jgi:hypothetical protein